MALTYFLLSVDDKVFSSVVIGYGSILSFKLTQIVSVNVRISYLCGMQPVFAAN